MIMRNTLRTAKQVAYALGISSANFHRAACSGKQPAAKGGQQGRTSRRQIGRKARHVRISGREG